MTFDAYQAEAHVTAVYPTCFIQPWADRPDDLVEARFVYPCIGLAGEVGEVAEKLKKIIRDSQGLISGEQRQLIAKELGDVLWYIAETASSLDLSLSDIAKGNIAKLCSRASRGVLQGSGDIR